MTVAETGVSDIPTEILEKILDLLHDDPAALYSASLVCRKWVSAPRYHMFNRTIIKEIDVPFRHTMMMQENVESFLSLSQSRYCTILPAMRCVVLCITPTWLDEVIKVLASAKALCQVVYIQFDDDSPPPPWMAEMLPDVHDFTYDTWFDFGEDEWRLLSSFSHLRALAIHADRNKPMTFPRDISGSFLCNIVNLQLRLSQCEQLFDWASNLERPSLTRVETLDLRIFRSYHKGWGSVNALNSFLRVNSTTMKHLSFSINYYGSDVIPEDSSEDNIDLSPLINLRSLFLQTHDMNSVCDTVSSISSCLVESLTVHTFRWLPDEGHFDNRLECFCDFYDLFTKLAEITEGKQFNAPTTVLNLAATKQPRIDGLYWTIGYVNIRWTQNGILAFSEDLQRYDKQCNTFATLKRFLEEPPLNRSGRPIFLR